MKASQVIARIEAAGWKKIRSEGSHVIFEHPKYGRRSTAFGRPQRDVNKHRLLEVVEDFHLAEIEQAKIEARLAEAKRRPEPARVALARVTPEPETYIDMSIQEARLLWAQLHKEHGMSLYKLEGETHLEWSHLMGFLHHGVELPEGEWQTLKRYLADQERRHKLTRNRAELLKKGYGARTGSSNAVDPFIAVAREALLKTLDAGVRITELATTIGIGASVIHGIKSGRVKTIHPGAKDKLQKWIGENWAEPVGTDPTPPPITGPEPVETRQPASDIDDELVAIQIVLKAIKPLNQYAAKRALRYVLERME